MKSTALFFGSFDPIHLGHLTVARHVLLHEGFEEVWFVVSPMSPFKTNTDMLPVVDRLSMVEAALQIDKSMRAERIELDMPQPSYTYDTLVELARRHPDRSFGMVLGSDNLASFDQWKNAAEILSMVDLYVYERDGFPPGLTRDGVVVTEAPIVPISSTIIRDMINQGEDVSAMVPDIVLQIIKEKGYYTSSGKDALDHGIE